MNKVIKFVLLSLLLSSCASYQAGSPANVLQGQHPEHVPITADVDELYSYGNFLFVNITMGNSNQEWIRIKNTQLNLSGSMNQQTNLILGPDLQTWAASMQHKISIDNHNRQIWMGALVTAMAATAIAGGAKGNTSMALIGIGGMAGLVTLETVNETLKKASGLERSNIVPPDHFYAPFSVPPGLYTKRWVLLQIPKDQRPCDLYFDIEYLDGKQAQYQVKLRYPSYIKCQKV